MVDGYLCCLSARLAEASLRTSSSSSIASSVEPLRARSLALSGDNTYVVSLDRGDAHATIPGSIASLFHTRGSTCGDSTTVDHYVFLGPSMTAFLDVVHRWQHLWWRNDKKFSCGFDKIAFVSIGLVTILSSCIR